MKVMPFLLRVPGGAGSTFPETTHPGASAPAALSLGTSSAPVERHGLASAPWLALCPPGAVEVSSVRGPAVRSLPRGTAVVLTCDGPSSRRLLRRAARRGGLRIERELIVLPSTSRPVVVLDDEESAVRHFWSSYATVPPGMARGSVLASPLLSLARLMPWRWTGALAPGRVLVGSRR